MNNNFITSELNKYYKLFNNNEFINSDPIQIPHLFKKKEDIEISGFLTATIAWGNRKMIINNAKKLMQIMDYEPFKFITNASNTEINKASSFVHRTFNGDDSIEFIKSLRNIYLFNNGLEAVFTKGFIKDNTIKSSLIYFRKIFISYIKLKRSFKHISDVEKGSAAKRLNMFLRWMVRKDLNGVDFGLWENIPMSELKLPLDVHSANMSRKLGLLKRKQNDWKAVCEVTDILKEIDNNDPIKFDFALFGMGVNKIF